MPSRKLSCGHFGWAFELDSDRKTITFDHSSEAPWPSLYDQSKANLKRCADQDTLLRRDRLARGFPIAIIVSRNRFLAYPLPEEDLAGRLLIADMLFIRDPSNVIGYPIHSLHHDAEAVTIIE